MPPIPNGSESAYARYLSMPTPADTVRGWLFNGLLSFVKSQAGEPALAQCQQLLGDPRTPLSFVSFSSYPATDFLRVADAVSRVLLPHLGDMETIARQLGMATVREFLSSTVGKTRLAMSGTSPRRLLSNLPAAYREAVNFGERTVTMRGDTGAHLSFKRDFLPLAHTEGMLLALLEAGFAQNCQVRARSLGPLDSDYELSWE